MPGGSEERRAVAALVNDLHWQIDQMAPRGIKNSAGNPYNPSYYKRGLQAAIDRGGWAPADYILRYLNKPPSDGYRKLEDANSLDLACEALIADADKPYAWLFTDDQREAARERLGHHRRQIERRKEATRKRIGNERDQLPTDLEALRALAATARPAERAVAINAAIADLAPTDVAALNRLGRAHEALGSVEEASATFRRALAIDPGNTIAKRRLRDIERKRS